VDAPRETGLTSVRWLGMALVKGASAEADEKVAGAIVLGKLKFWCLALLAAVLAHALLPFSLFEIPVQGSPFSPATVDVATGHDRRPALDHTSAVEPPAKDHSSDVVAPLAAFVITVLVLSLHSRPKGSVHLQRLAPGGVRRSAKPPLPPRGPPEV